MSPAEHGCGLLAQRWLFAGPSDLVSDELYARVLRGSASGDRRRITLQPGSEVTGDTYFGRFPASYWQRWTLVPTVTVQALTEGDGQLSVVACDTQGETRVIATCAVAGSPATPVLLTARLDRFADGGMLWLTAKTGTSEMTIADVRWQVSEPPARHRTFVALCTTDRPVECLATLRALAGDPVALGTLEAVTVVDHGTDRADYAPVERQMGGKLRHLVQDNLGGAGGFARGMYEADGRADVLVMDDDIVLEPDLVVRLTAFRASAAEPLICGGQMLNQLHPAHLHAGAEHTDLDRIRPGVPAPRSPHGVDLLIPDRRTGRLVRQEHRVDAGYNGWWACLIPREVIRDIGYPLPLFFQGDDAEYSYRARSRGFRTVTLPGAGLWHTDFPWKDRDEINRYFIVRNYTIIAGLHGSFRVHVIIQVLLGELTAYLLGMQYGAAATLIAAVEDFLAGPETLRDGGTAALSRIRELRSRYPETRCRPATVIGGVPIADAADPPGPRDLLLRPVLAALLGRHRHASGAIPHAQAHWWHAAAFETAMVTDASQRGVRIRRYDRALLGALTLAGAKALARLAAEGPEAARRYRRALPELSSRSHWARLFGLGHEER